MPKFTTKRKATPKPKSTTVEQQLRAAITSNELTLHAISKGAGVSYPQVYHFAHGERDIRLSAAGRLADFLGLELAPKKAGRKRS